MRIVVVEDEERSRTGLSHLIESVGKEFKVVGQARDGAEGIELIHHQLPDVVFVDIIMPVMNGLEMIEHIVEAGKAKCAFVIVSAHSDFEYARRALRSNAVDYILKPVTYEETERMLYKLSGTLSSNPFAGGRVDELFPVPEGANPLVLSAIALVKEHYAGPLSLDDVASRLGVTNEYLSQLFSKQMSVGFTSYVKHYRVDAAKHLLLQQKWRIQDVAGMTGYQNAKYFIRVFREVTGLTPSEFVKQHAGVHA